MLLCEIAFEWVDLLLFFKHVYNHMNNSYNNMNLRKLLKLYFYINFNIQNILDVIKNY